tara:strand:- start:13475 stop:14359 length:885 start_codon:yes stop_codon:yes gene_type:complete
MRNIKYFDKNINRKSKIIRETIQFNKKKFPLPSLVEISDSGTCNRSCSFCPRSDPDYKDVKEFISEELHIKIFKELSELNYQGLVIYSGFNEPLLNKNVYKNLKSAREYLPDAKFELITNGDVLNEDRLKKLFLSGLNTILISVYDGPEDMKKFQKMCEKVGLNEKQYVIRNRYLPPEQDFGITMSNRGGLMEKADHKIGKLKSPLKQKCNYPSYTFFIDYNGDVLMCSHDWGKKKILGNLYKQSIMEIWTSKQSMAARKRLINSDRNFSPCDVCDVSGGLIGESHASAWDKIL